MRVGSNLGFDLIPVGGRFTWSPYDAEVWRKESATTARCIQSRLPGVGALYNVTNIYRAAWTLDVPEPIAYPDAHGGERGSGTDRYPKFGGI